MTFLNRDRRFFINTFVSSFLPGLGSVTYTGFRMNSSSIYDMRWAIQEPPPANVG